MKIQPLGKYFLVKPDNSKDKANEAGIIIPDQVEQDQKAIATVISVPQNNENPLISIGKKVIYGIYAGDKVNMQGPEDTKKEPYLLLHIEDILAIVEE